MQLERALERLRESFERDVVLGPRLVRAGAVAAVDRQVRVEHERGPRLVVVELERRQVHSVRTRDAAAHELIEQLPDRGAALNDVLVELRARLARDAPKHDEQRLSRLLGQAGRARQVVIDPRPERLDALPVRADLLSPLLLLVLRRGRVARGSKRDDEDDEDAVHRGSMPPGSKGLQAFVGGRSAPVGTIIDNGLALGRRRQAGMWCNAGAQASALIFTHNAVSGLSGRDAPVAPASWPASS